MNLSSKVRVAVLRGGPSNGYDISLKTGNYILSTLRDMSEIYEPLDVFISKDGEWHRDGLVHEPHRALQYVDVVWNTFLSSYGEAGQIERVLEGLQIPFTGSSAVASTLAVNKDMARRLYRENSLLTPDHELITKNDLSEDRLVAIFRRYLQPVIVKPANASGFLGASLSYSFGELKQSVKNVLNYSPRVLIEGFIKGDEVSCTVIEGAKGEKIYALIPVLQEFSSRISEIGERDESMRKSRFKLKVEENKKIEEMAKRAHEVLGLSHYSGSNFVITPKGKIYILETNSLPVLHEGSLMHQSLDATGWRPRDFVDHVLKLVI